VKSKHRINAFGGGIFKDKFLGLTLQVVRGIEFKS